MSDIMITITSARPGMDSALLSERLANFLHTQGLQVELADSAIQPGSQQPSAVTIRTATRQRGNRQGGAA